MYTSWSKSRQKQIVTNRVLLQTFSYGYIFVETYHYTSLIYNTHLNSYPVDDLCTFKKELHLGLQHLVLSIYHIPLMLIF